MEKYLKYIRSFEKQISALVIIKNAEKWLLLNIKNLIVRPLQNSTQ